MQNYLSFADNVATNNTNFDFAMLPCGNSRVREAWVSFVTLLSWKVSRKTLTSLWPSFSKVVQRTEAKSRKQTPFWRQWCLTPYVIAPNISNDANW